MIRIAISGPVKVPAAIGVKVREDFEKRISEDDTVCSGAAYGIDTIGANVAKNWHRTLLLIAPEKLWHNESLREIADEVIDVPGSYMDRNDRLSVEADMLIAYPATAEEELRSGTWATVRRFRKLNKPVVIVPLTSL